MKLPNLNSASRVEVSLCFRVTRMCDCPSLTRLILAPWFQALHMALHMFDMMESVLVRIEELTEKENL